MDTLSSNDDISTSQVTDWPKKVLYKNGKVQIIERTNKSTAKQKNSVLSSSSKVNRQPVASGSKTLSNNKKQNKTNIKTTPIKSSPKQPKRNTVKSSNQSILKSTRSQPTVVLTNFCEATNPKIVLK